MTKNKRKAEHNGTRSDLPPAKKQATAAGGSDSLRSQLAELQTLLSTAQQDPEKAPECLVKIGRKSFHAFYAANSALVPGGRNAEGDQQGDQATNGRSSSRLPELPMIKDHKIEKAVFTYQGSLGAKENVSDALSYERYELLGDAYVEVMATRLIWHLFPNLPTGRLSHLRQTLVNNQTLGEFSTMYGFDGRLYLPLIVSTNLKAVAKIKGDVFEAYVAALIIDDPIDGFERAENWLHQLWLPKLKNVDQSAGHNPHAKEELAKKIGGKAIKITYVDERPVINAGGGILTHFIGVYLSGWGYENEHLGSGKGLSKTAAGNVAAEAAINNHPLIDEIIEKKRIFHETIKREREKEIASKEQG